MKATVAVRMGTASSKPAVGEGGCVLVGKAKNDEGNEPCPGRNRTPAGTPSQTVPLVFPEHRSVGGSVDDDHRGAVTRRAT